MPLDPTPHLAAAALASLLPLARGRTLTEHP